MVSSTPSQPQQQQPQQPQPQIQASSTPSTQTVVQDTQTTSISQPPLRRSLTEIQSLDSSSEKEKQGEKTKEKKGKQQKRKRGDSESTPDAPKKRGRGRPSKSGSQHEEEGTNLLIMLFNLYLFNKLSEALAAKPIEPSLFDKAISAMAPYMWNCGRSYISLPIDIISEPDPEWGARQKDPAHVKVNFL